MTKIEELEKDIAAIKARNERVEADKSWETSWTRRVVIFILTYGAIAVYFYFVGLPEPLINSVVPAVAFVISTLSLPLFRKIWAKYLYKK